MNTDAPNYFHLSDAGGQVLHWMCRDYESSEFWKQEARSIYLATWSPESGADSASALRILSSRLQKLLDFFGTKKSFASVWAKEGEETNGDDIVKSEIRGSGIVLLKKIPEPCLAIDKEDWIAIANYFLSCGAGVSWEEYDRLNEKIVQFNNGISQRTDSNIERVKEFDKEWQVAYIATVQQNSSTENALFSESVCPEIYGRKKSPTNQRKIGMLIEQEDAKKTIALPSLLLYTPPK